MCCNIEIDVNGEHIFFLDKKMLASFSNRVRKLLARVANAKLIFNDFPGGAKSFELITSFCYNNGNIDITPSNIFLLHSASTFMEMTTLTMQTELFLEGTYCWTWSQFVNGLKQCHILFHFINNSPTFQHYLNSLLVNLTLPSYNVSSSCQWSSDSSSFRVSSSNTSSKSLWSSNHLDNWKLNDLSFLNIDLFDKLITSMILLHFDHPTICSFIFHYQKSKYILCCSHDEKSRISERNINLLMLLKSGAFSCRALLDAFGMSLSSNMKMGERSKLENLLGSRLHEFTINDLLIRGKKKGAFDVDLILRLIKSFLLERRICGLFVPRAEKVGFLMDLFMLEVAPDPLLAHSTFLSLAMALPKLARESHDRMYHAINLYVQMHQDLCQEQTAKIWSALDLNKLSVATMRLHLAKNTICLPFVKQNQFKVFLNDDFGILQVSRHVDNAIKNEKRDITFTRKIMPKKSRTFVPCNAKSLPRLCHQ